ncbi:hypothetical protein K469DRAFT_694337 [Zopfia rhizophila CBS 207.26]|uniref:Uncharacterized protein n=1 Tax=Zopfia rhizophila CBS 207.26 TaxID=1314779 RepID=A0A6A6EMC3_9PEZI|nr:hypothetical protein K469DRAFT_694337 [Zopfia rhizophila CBS 207.26]
MSIIAGVMFIRLVVYDAYIDHGENVLSAPLYFQEDPKHAEVLIRFLLALFGTRRTGAYEPELEGRHTRVSLVRLLTKEERERVEREELEREVGYALELGVPLKQSADPAIDDEVSEVEEQENIDFVNFGGDGTFTASPHEDSTYDGEAQGVDLHETPRLNPTNRKMSPAPKLSMREYPPTLTSSEMALRLPKVLDEKSEAARTLKLQEQAEELGWDEPVEEDVQPSIQQETVQATSSILPVIEEVWADPFDKTPPEVRLKRIAEMWESMDFTVLSQHHAVENEKSVSQESDQDGLREDGKSELEQSDRSDSEESNEPRSTGIKESDSEDNGEFGSEGSDKYGFHEIEEFVPYEGKRLELQESEKFIVE